MDVLRDLLAVDSTQTLRFFLNNLSDQVAKKPVPNNEVLYVASILAHYAQTSRYDTSELMPVPVTLSETFDNFVLHGSELRDGEIFEIGGAQVILLAGFFRDQMKGRHDVRWYDKQGQSFFERASGYSTEKNRRELLGRMAQFLPFWTITCRNLSRRLATERLILKLD